MNPVHQHVVAAMNSVNDKLASLTAQAEAMRAELEPIEERIGHLQVTAGKLRDAYQWTATLENQS
jgi:prefoldin subunit 5